MKKLKILHISTDDSSGAGLCCYRIHSSLLSMGIDSRMLVLKKTLEDETIVEYGRTRHFFWRLLNKILRLFHLKLTDYNKILVKGINSKKVLTLPTSVLDLSKHPLVKDADIIHIHWANTFLDYTRFFSKITTPVVFTLHDENLFCGISHYVDSMLENDEYEDKFLKKKLSAIGHIQNFGIVFLSRFMFDRFKDYPIIQNARKHIINNSVDCSLFSPQMMIDSRLAFGLSKDNIVLSFVASKITDPRKGLATLIRAIRAYHRKGIKILAVGDASDYSEENSDIVIPLGIIRSPEELSKVYSASDIFVMPSMQEAFAQTPMEAMACGTPVLAFPVSGTDELITDFNGYRCPDFTEHDLSLGLDIILGRSYDRNLIRADVMNRFSPRSIADKYIVVYKDLLG